MKGRFWFSIVMATIGTGLLLAAGFATDASSSPQAAGKSDARGGTLRIDYTGDFDYIDTSLAYFNHSWQILNATQLKLLSFPDLEGTAGTRMRAEAAAGFPKVSSDGKTYTFTVKRGFKFSDGSNVTAANFKAALDRAKNAKMQSPASSFLDDVASYRTIGQYQLQVKLKVVAPDFLARITMPFFSAIPVNRPIVAEGVQAPMVSAGPYYIKEWVQKRSALVVRNPHWDNSKEPWKSLKRPANVNQIQYTFGNTQDASLLRTRRNETDYALSIPPASASELSREFGINKGRYFIRKEMVFWYLALNNDSALFKNNPKLRQAVNWAIDRPQIVRQHGFLAGGRTDQILPPGMPGYKNGTIYSLQGVNNASLTKARGLANGNTRGGKAVFYAYNTAPGPAIAQVVQFNLKQIGVDVEIKQFTRTVQHEKVGTRGEPFDISHSGWGADYPDPYNFINVLLDGRKIQATNNVNESYFNTPAYNAKMEAASRLSGAARLTAYGNLDIDIMRNQAPLAPYINTNRRAFVSESFGCFTYSAVNSNVNFVAVCKK
jgi:peptide/nickel transport system substrate-binding protein